MNLSLPLITTPEKARLTAEDFLLLDKHGAFDAYSKAELLDGEIWYVDGQHSRHARIKTRLAREIGNVLEELGGELEPMCGPATRLDDRSLLEPDIVVTDYKGSHVVPLETVALLVEVSDTTLDIDLGRKLRIYARAGIPEYWVVDVQAGKVLQMWSPEAEGFRERREVALGERLEAVTIAGLAVPTSA